MNKKLFGELAESMEQMNEIARGERAPSREFHIEPLAIKELRSKLGLSQSKFAKLLHVDVGTLRNWEQGRRVPTGPARALLTLTDPRLTTIDSGLVQQSPPPRAYRLRPTSGVRSGVLSSAIRSGHRGLT